MNHISGVVVSVFALSVINRVFEPRSGQTHDFKIGICSFFAMQQREKTKSGWIGIRIMCPSGATCLLMECCFSELTL